MGVLRSLFAPPRHVDHWMDSRVNVKHGKELCLVSTKGLIDGLIIGFVIGGALGILQGWMKDAKVKDLCLLSTDWAINGAAIGAVAITLGNTIVQTDMTPGFYVVR